MPRIINAYQSGNDSIAESLRGIGDSMFANQAHQEFLRQNAEKARRENEAALAGEAAFRAHDPTGVYATHLRGGGTGADAANYVLGMRSLEAHGNVDNPELATAQLAAHEPIRSTAVGQTRDLANEIAKQKIASGTAAATQQAIAERQVQQQQWADEHTLVNLRGPDGRIQMVPKSQVGNLQVHGYEVVPSLDQVKAGIVTGAMQPPSGQAAPQTAQPSTQMAMPASAPPAPAPAAVPPMSQMSPDVRSIVGLPTGVQSYLHPHTGETVTSQDGGLTFIDRNGRRGLIAGSGFMPADHAAALEQERGNAASAAIPAAPAAPAVGQGQAAQDAATTTGIVPFVQKHANAELGALPGVSAVLHAATGSGQIGAETEAARSRQELRNNEIRSTIMGMPGRPSNYAQRMVDQLLPQGSAMENPETEAQHVTVLVNQLRQDREEAAIMARNPAVPPQDRVKAAQHIAVIDKTIRSLVAPAEAQAPPTGAPPAAAPARPRATNPQTGAVVEFDGQAWVPVK